MESKAIYRYPGSRPFEDTDIDRKLFFGRKREKDDLLQKIIAGNLLVLHAESGLGKTSLLNAGVSALLRERGFLPIKIRFNRPETRPVQTIFDDIKETAERQNLDIEPGETETLWHYFKTAAFWSSDDNLLTPVLIFDQFEEFFAFHEPESRAEFTLQLADIVHNTIPRALRKAIRAGEPYRYGEEPPRVKIVISIRSDFMGQLDELSSAIPEILDNRYRLLALTRLQAREAITGPAQIEDEQILTRRFRYSENAVNTMLDYLSKRQEREGVVNKDEIESFQLQLLCRHIETSLTEKAGKDSEQDELEVKKEDLGGEAGLHKVFQSFYEDRLAGLKPVLNKRRVRRLFEKGLISDSGRRLSLEEEVIEKQFKVSPVVLAQLVDNRLLRAEQRVGSVYYELSHDSLVIPIRLSQQKHKGIFQKKYIPWFLAAAVVIAVAVILTPGGYKVLAVLAAAVLLRLFNILYMKEDHYQKSLEGNHEDAYHYFRLGYDYYELKKYDAAIASYRKALELKPDYAETYNNMGAVQFDKGEIDAAIVSYRKALKLKPGDAEIYNNMGNAQAVKGDYDGAMVSYHEALKINPDYTIAYYNMGNAQYNNGDIDNAVISYLKALELKPDYALAYNTMGNVQRKKGDYNAAIANFKKALEIEPTYLLAKENLAELYLTTECFEKAMEMAQQILKEKDVPQNQILAMRSIFISALFFQGYHTQAIMELQQLIMVYRGLTNEYKRDWYYSQTKVFITQTQSLNEPTRTLLLKMIDLLEAPKKEGEKILVELETMAREYK